MGLSLWNLFKVRGLERFHRVFAPRALEFGWLRTSSIREGAYSYCNLSSPLTCNGILMYESFTGMISDLLASSQDCWY